MKKYVIAALLFVNAGLLSTIYMVLQHAPTPEIEGKNPLASSGENAKTGPETEPSLNPQVLTEPPPVIPNIFDEERPLVTASSIGLTERDVEGKAAPNLFPVNSASPARLRREGTKVDMLVGTVRRQGSRFEFLPVDGTTPLILLENQLLQRIDYVQDRQPNASAIRWKVSGLVTEYLGDNYLLLQWLVTESP